MKLDNYWVMSNYICPICGKRLLYDTNENKEATHYCKEHGGMLIVLNSALRR